MNRNPSVEEMAFWGQKQGYSLPMVTSFTDGTKVQIEQCLVANGLGAGIEPGEIVSLDDVDRPENAALEMWRTIEARALAAAAAVVTVRGVVRAVPLP